MCKARADGGARCAAHLGAGIDTAMVALAARQSGLSHRETAAALAHLRREGAHLAAPDQDEVSTWLTAQEFRARFDPDLSEPKRQSILNRLRAGLANISRLRPSGGQFHAWRHLVGETSSRARRKIAAVLLAGGLAAGIGGCGTPGEHHAASLPDRPAATATAPAPPAADAPATVQPGHFSGEPVRVFGQTQVNEAYREATTWSSTYAYDPALMATAHPAADDFEPLTAAMTPSAAADFRTKVQQALGGDRVAIGAVQGITFYNFQGNGFVFAPAGQRLNQHTITNPTVGVDRSTGSPRLQVSYREETNLNGTYNGQPSRAHLTKDLTLWLTPAPAGNKTAWLIDGVSSHFQVSQPTATP